MHEEVYIIIAHKSEYCPGDYPNDPGYSKEYDEATTYTDRIKWEKAIKSMTERKEPFKAYIAQPVTVTTTVHINIA